MKKYFAIIVFIGLALWGFGTVQSNKSDSNMISSQRANVGLEVGNLAPDFELKTVEGNSIKLSSLKGKKVILNFWATWCPPCRQEMPDMEKFYTENKDSGIEILAVNLLQTEKGPAEVSAFIQDFGITFPVVVDEQGSVGKLYKVSSIPASFIIDSEGVIQRKIVGPMTYDSMKSMLGAIK